MAKEPRILLYDIECTNLSASMGYVLAIGYKFLGDKKVTMLTLANHPGKSLTDDSRLLQAFEKIHDSADMVCYHFGEFYDEPFLNTRRLIHGMKPMAKVAKVDTWRIAKKRLKFHSNRLDAIARALGCPVSKTQVDGKVWVEAGAGDRKALKYIADHCEKDILVLEWVYQHIKSAWDQHPSVYGKDRCNNCGGTDFISNGLRPTIKKVYRRLVCKNCGVTTKGAVL